MKHLSEPKRRLVDVLSDYDEEKLGLLPVSSLKKCLHCHSIDLTSSEFRLVFDGYPQQQLCWWCCRFIQNDKVNYINFLKSWSDLSSEIDSPQSIKRASSGEDSGIGYTYIFAFFSLTAEAPNDVLFWPLQTTPRCSPWRSRFVFTSWVFSGTCSLSSRHWQSRTACICMILLGILRNIASPARCRSSTVCFSPSCRRPPRSRSPSSKSTSPKRSPA